MFITFLEKLQLQKARSGNAGGCGVMRLGSRATALSSRKIAADVRHTDLNVRASEKVPPSSVSRVSGRQ